MVNCLRDDFLYSEKRARDILFRVIADILSDLNRHGEPPIMSRLTREAANRARLEAERIGFDFTNWDTAGKAVIRGMLAARVLLSGDGTAISPGIAAQATPVARLKESYADITEAYLIQVLIRKLGDLSTRDHTALAHALFRQFDPNIPIEDMEDRVVVLLATLADRVVLNDDGTYSILE